MSKVTLYARVQFGSTGARADTDEAAGEAPCAFQTLFMGSRPPYNGSQPPYKGVTTPGRPNSMQTGAYGMHPGQVLFRPSYFFFITLGPELSDYKSTSLKYEPSSELLLITAKQLFLNRELYLAVQLSV